MKYVALGLVLVLGQAGQAQVSAFGSLTKALQEKGVIKFKQSLPFGEVKPGPQVSKLPASDDENGVLKIVDYGDINSNGDEIELTNGAEIVDRGFRCLANRIVGNKVTEIFTCSGDVRIIGQDETIVGESITVNFKNKTFSATYGKAQIKPNALKNQVLDDIFLSGKQAYGSEKKIYGVDSVFTTCDLDKPHFHFDADSSTIDPNKEAILHHVRINILGRNVITLPLLWIPLGDRSFKYLPQFGHSTDEGYYVKNTYGFPMHGDDRGAIRTDYMSKLGYGLGANYFYRNANMNGIARIYGVFGDSKTVTISNQHEQRIGSATLLIDNDIQRNNYLTAPGSTLINTRAQLKLPKFTSFSFSQQQQSASSYSSYNQTISMADTRQWGKTNTAFNLTFNNTGGTSSSRQTADVRFNGSKDVGKGSFSLEYQRTIPIGEVTNFFPSSDKTPVLSFKSDSSKLFGQDFMKTLPFRTELSVGEYLDPILKQRVSRGLFDMLFNRATRDKGNWKWDFNGEYRQTLYSDDTALYRLNMGQGVSYAIGKKLSVNLRYSYLRSFGYSPLAIDRSGLTNVATLDVSFMKNSKSSFGVQTGYDFIRTSTGLVPWQQVGIRSEYKLGNNYSLRTLTNYDTYNMKWSNFRIDSTWQTPTMSASIGARYDGINHSWSTISAYLDGVEYGKTKLGTVLNFNGYTGRLDTQQYNLVYDLHCAEAILTVSDYGTGFRAGREIGFFIRLKAIPFDSSFGTNRRGSAVGSGTGFGF
ncbi:MAG: hypothetical protein GC165_17395 [Armatimonadetes bacterium]|nr:hypothetical protein [Armatimonadota bacterium]